MRNALPSGFEGFVGEVSGLVSDEGKSVRIKGIRVLGKDDRKAILDTERVDVFAERNTLGVVDGVNNVIFRSMEMLGKEEDREVGIAESLLLLYIFLEKTGEGGGIATAAGGLGYAFGTVVYHIDSMPNIDGYGGKGQAISKIEQQKMILVERICYLAKEEDNNAEVGGDIDSFEIKVMEAIGGVVFGINAFETQELADAGDKDEERFDEEDGPKEIEVGKNNEVVSP